MRPQRTGLARAVSAVIVFACSSSSFAKDPMMMNHVKVRDKEAAAAVRDANRPPPQCEFGDEPFKVCSNVEFDEAVERPFKDIAAMPLANSATAVKIGVLRYNMRLGGDLKIPFSLLSSNVAGTTNQAKLNSLKLLDPDQGNLNFKWTYAGRYHFGQFCNFAADDKGKCNAGVNIGYRYLGLEKSTGANATSSQNTYGAYLELTNSFIFPVLRVATAKAEDKDAGQLVVKLSLSRFQQNAGDAVLFPDARDVNGNPLKVGKSYNGFAMTAKLNITDKVGLEANRYRAGGSNSLIGNITTVSVALDIP